MGLFIIPFIGAGLFNGTIPEDGVLSSERRTGRKSRRQKSSAKSVNTNSQFVSFEKVNIDNGQVRVKDGLHGDKCKIYLDFGGRTNLFFFMALINQLELVGSSLCCSYVTFYVDFILWLSNRVQGALSNVHTVTILILKHHNAKITGFKIILFKKKYIYK